MGGCEVSDRIATNKAMEEWRAITPDGHIFRWACFRNDGRANKIGPDDLSAPMGERDYADDDYKSWRLVEECIQLLGRGEDTAILRAYLVHTRWAGEPTTSFKIVRRSLSGMKHDAPQWLTTAMWQMVLSQEVSLLVKIREKSK